MGGQVSLPFIVGSLGYAFWLRISRLWVQVQEFLFLGGKAWSNSSNFRSEFKIEKLSHKFGGFHFRNILTSIEEFDVWGEYIMCIPHQHNIIRARDLYSLVMFLINKNIKDDYIALSLENKLWQDFTNANCSLNCWKSSFELCCHVTVTAVMPT